MYAIRFDILNCSSGSSSFVGVERWGQTRSFITCSGERIVGVIFAGLSFDFLFCLAVDG
jgi:hypothetical protein